MRSKKAQFNIEVIKRVNLGHIPLFIQLAHQGLLKSQPEPLKTIVGRFVRSETYTIPKDILKLTISDPKIYEDVTSIEFTYEWKVPEVIGNESIYDNTIY